MTRASKMPDALRRAAELYALLLFGCLAAAAPAGAQSVANFYRNRQIDFLNGATPGDVFSQWTDAITRYMAPRIPGEPNFVVRMMPGGGNLVVTNYLFNAAPRDGSAIGMISNDMSTQEALGNPAVKFKSTQFNYIGGPDSSHRVCVAYSRAKVQKAQDLFSEELLVGGSGAGSAVSTTPVLLNKLLGLKLKLVEGYQGGPQIFLAMERGEVDGICETLSAIESVRPGWLQQGRLKILFNLEKQPIPGGGAPSIQSLTKTDEQRQIIAFYNSNIELGRPVVAPPGVPADRVEALRRAFDGAVKNPGFLDQAHKSRFTVDPVGGEELTARVAAMINTPKSIVDKTEELMGKK